MSERFLSSGVSEVEFTKKHIAGLSSVPGGAEYNRDFSLDAGERDRKIPVIPVARPPDVGSSLSPASASGLTLTVKSLKPPLSFSILCSPTASIASLKAQLHGENSARGAPEPERQRWLYKGKAMADERLLKEYDGLKDGETVHLAIKAAVEAAPVPSSSTPSSASTPTPTPATNTANNAKPKAPFSFTPSTLSSEMPPPAASRTRTTSSTSLSSSVRGAGAHSRVPSITLTTDMSNFNHLAGNATSPIDGNFSPGVPMATSPVPAYSPDIAHSGATGASGGVSGASTPRSTPGTPSGIGRQKSPSISVQLDLDNIEMMNPVSSDRKHPVGLSTKFIGTMKDPQTWSDVLSFLDGKFKAEKAAGDAPGILDGNDDYAEETKQVFETWLGASKDWMTASDIARIRDRTGVWAMGGR